MDREREIEGDEGKGERRRCDKMKDASTFKECLGLVDCLGEAVQNEALVLAGLGEQSLAVELQHILLTVEACGQSTQHSRYI